MSNRHFKSSQVDSNRQPQQLTTGSHVTTSRGGPSSAAAAAVSNAFLPSHLDLLSPISMMGVFNNAPDSPPDAMDLVTSDFSEFENRNSVSAITQQQPVDRVSVSVAKSTLRSVRPQHQSGNILARKSAPPEPMQQPQPQSVPANSDNLAGKSNANRFITQKQQQTPINRSDWPITQPATDRHVVLEKRPVVANASPMTLVQRTSSNNFSVQESASTSVKGIVSQPPTMAKISPTSTLTESSKLSPQELERIRINRASEYYRLQREKIMEMNQQPVRQVSEDSSSSSSPSPPPGPPLGAGGIPIGPPTRLTGTRNYNPVARAGKEVITTQQQPSTTAALRAKRIVKVRQHQPDASSTVTPSTQTRGLLTKFD